MYEVMARGKGVPVHVNEYLRDWLAREWLAKGHTQQELADKAEVNKTTVSDFRNGKRGAGYDLFVAFARILGRSRDDIEQEALDWWQARGNTVEQKKDPHPNRAAALEFLRGDVPSEVIDRVRAVTIDATGDPSRAWWVARIMSEADIYRARKP
jgi:transcriptional regulator with XRE-family HTH domain